MWPTIGILALAASLFPLAACAQSSQNAGPPPDVRAKIDAVRSDTKTAAFASLSDAHRAAVQSIVDQFDADGSTLTLDAAAAQIDGVLTPQESSAVLAQRDKMRDAMRAAFAGSGGAPGGGRGFGGSPGGAHRTPDAGRFLLQVDASPERYRAAARAENGAGR